jgi:thiamine kinase
MRDVRAILGGMPGFETAAVRAVLSDGPTNASYRVERNGMDLVLRVDKPAAAELGLDRSAERQVLQALAVAGLAEAPLFSDTAGGIMLRRFVPGRTWTREDITRPEMLARLAVLLREVHAVPPAGRRFDALGAARAYAEQVGTPRACRIYEAAAAAFADIPPAPPALCHNDPVCGNILEADDGLRLIDWEYAGIGDPFFDLAVVVEHHGVQPRVARGFLATYLGRAAQADEVIRLERQCRFYGHLLDLWRLRTAEASAAGC